MPRISEELVIPFTVSEEDAGGTGTVKVIGGSSRSIVTPESSRTFVVGPQSTLRVAI